jgi:lipoprotein NlpI
MKVCFGFWAAVMIGTSIVPRLAGAEADWRELLANARTAWRTNPAAALKWCDRAVELAGTNVAPLLFRAALENSRRDYDTALKDVTKALRSAPRLAEAYQLRGEIYFRLSRFRESVQDFGRFLEIVPAQRAYHWQRGISLYYAGDYEGGRKQFELHESVNPNDVENAIWHFLCVARQSGVEAARQNMLKPGPDARVPMTEIYALFAGKGSEEQVLRAATSMGQRDSSFFYAHLYLGLYFDAFKNPNRAREHLEKAVAIGPSHYMGDVARVQLKKLEAR